MKSREELLEENKYLRQELREYIRRNISLEKIINQYNDIFNKNKIILARYIKEMSEKKENGVEDRD